MLEIVGEDLLQGIISPQSLFAKLTLVLFHTLDLGGFLPYRFVIHGDRFDGYGSVISLVLQSNLFVYFSAVILLKIFVRLY